MNTEFFKVFPVLELSQERADWFSEVSVAKVAASKSKQRICIYIEKQPSHSERRCEVCGSRNQAAAFWACGGKYSNSRALYLV